MDDRGQKTIFAARRRLFGGSKQPIECLPVVEQ